VSVTFIVTEDEFMAAQRLFREKGLPAYVRIWRKVAIVLGVLLVVGSFAHLFARGMHVATMPHESWQMQLAWLVPIVVGIWLISQYWWGYDLGASRAYHLDRWSEHPVTWGFFSDGLRLETQTVRAEMLWSSFQWYAESNESVIISLLKNRFFMFPKRAFSANDLAEFQALLKKNVPERK
jgi:hypothetical protein